MTGPGRSKVPAGGSVPPGDTTLVRQVAIFARRLQADYMHRIKRTGLTPAQANALRVLYFAPCSSQVELARRMEVRKAHAGQVLKSLEEASLVSRGHAGDNQRSLRIALTAQGEAMVATLSTAANAMQDDLREALGTTLADILVLALVEANRKVPPADDIGEVA